MMSQEQGPSSAPRPDEQAAPDSPRSGYGSVPGSEFPVALYITVLAAFAWVVIASWLAFGRDNGVDLDLAIASVLGLVFFALPIILCRVAAARSNKPREAQNHFFSSRVETATGSLTGGEAWLQVLLIPLALAFAATVIGVAFMFIV